MPKTANDPFAVANAKPNFAGRHAAVVTPSDTVDLPSTTKAIWIGATGNLAVIMADDVDTAPVTFNGVPAGTMLNVQARRVMATGTTVTAGNVVALWG